MMACLVIGDSLAVGVAQARPNCEMVAVAGISSQRFVQSWIGTHAASNVVISLGANDGLGIDTLDNLRRLRASVQADAVYWLLPGNNASARVAIRTVAASHGDRVIDTAPLAGPDGLHPTWASYATLAAETRGGTPGVAGSAGAGSAYQDFAPVSDVYRAFPGVTVWNGPDQANGRYVPGSGGH